MNVGRNRWWVTAACWAFSSWIAGCALPPPSPAPGETRDRVTESDESESSKRARVRLELASAYFGRGQYTTALDEVKQAVSLNPKLGEAFNMRGLIYAALGDDTLAQESFKRALQLNPNDADSLHNYGWYQCQQKRYREAQALFQQALGTPQYPASARTLMTSGICHARAGEWAEAEVALSKAYERDPANPAAAVNLAEVLLRRGEAERARFYIRRVTSTPTQSSAQTLWLAARIEHKLGNRQGVNELGRELRSRFPQSRETSAFDRGLFNE
ncbi:type IV pilus biogenesis/stability protein PilW [Piscinibacter sp. HJYY11]|uniref:type IV pilus biogenesis/stability protein PilW n=1 Tax=Piscinibacter sp. HJYY11 TaxID=2801333 RepID=UPI00191E60EA|nr:type IV pilus biogenesis/stability protein PilW [Piscinibacter sp. HJYY11]MBL0726781.1 type IV pilus biogenesis/stability protein PilW [Piscinibacter sp. HJYY11]